MTKPGPYIPGSIERSESRQATTRLARKKGHRLGQWSAPERNFLLGSRNECTRCGAEVYVAYRQGQGWVRIPSNEIQRPCQRIYWSDAEMIAMAVDEMVEAALVKLLENSITEIREDDAAEDELTLLIPELSRQLDEHRILLGRAKDALETAKVRRVRS